MDTIALLAAGLVAAAAATALDRFYRYLRSRNRLPIILMIGSEFTEIHCPEPEARMRFENILHVSGTGRRKKIVVHGEVGLMAEPVPDGTRTIHLVRGVTDLQDRDLSDLWNAFLMCCCQKVLSMLGRPSAFAEIKVCVATGNARVDRLLNRGAARWLRLLGHVLPDSHAH
jgi:hypothetical protein